MVFDRLFSYKFPALLISQGLKPDEKCLAMAKKHNVTVLCSSNSTSVVISNAISYLKTMLDNTQ